MNDYLFWTLVILCPNPLWLWLLHVFYAACMNFKRIRDEAKKKGEKLHWVTMTSGYASLLVGWILDFRCNVIECWAIFLEPPKEALVTDRLKKYVHGSEGWRKNRAWAMAKAFELDKLDPSGNHLD